MPINLDEAIGAELDPVEFSWTSTDVQLYHLGLGAGADPMSERELRYLTDDTPQVLPTFGNVVQTFHMTEPPTVQFPGIDIELSQGAARQRGDQRTRARSPRRERAPRSPDSPRSGTRARPR